MNRYEKFIKELDTAYNNKDFNNVISVYKKYEDINLSIHMLINKSRAIQISDSDKYGYTLEDAKTILEKIINLDDRYIQSYIDLGYFYYAMEDNPLQAIEIFNTGISKVKKLLKELEIGKIESLFDLGEFDEALNVIELSEFKNDEALIRLKIDILEKEDLSDSCLDIS